MTVRHSTTEAALGAEDYPRLAHDRVVDPIGRGTTQHPGVRERQTQPHPTDTESRLTLSDRPAITLSIGDAEPGLRVARLF
jgi:hypothetical protein